MIVPITPLPPPIIFAPHHASTGYGPAPTTTEFIVYIMLSVLALWLFTTVFAWLMNLSVGERPNTLRGIIVAQGKFLVKAVKHVW